MNPQFNEITPEQLSELIESYCVDSIPDGLDSRVRNAFVALTHENSSKWVYVLTAYDEWGVATKMGLAQDVLDKILYGENDDKYRWANGFLYEFSKSKNSYIHCFKDYRVKTKKTAIKRYEERLLMAFEQGISIDQVRATK